MMPYESQCVLEYPKAVQATVLVVEPSRLLRSVVARACAKRGVGVVSKREVGTALSAIVKNKPTAVFTSYELPGIALIAALKSSPYHRAIPIGLVTSSGSAALNSDIRHPDAVIRKDDDFTGSIEHFLKSFNIGCDPRVARSTAPDKLEGRVLLAEDASVIQKLLGKILHVAGADVTVVENGVQALAAVSEHPFDLILMDIEMPEMDGWEATRRLRAQGVKIPIVASTAHDDEGFRSKALQAGFDEVLPKSAGRDVLIDTCREYLSRE